MTNILELMSSAFVLKAENRFVMILGVSNVNAS